MDLEQVEMLYEKKKAELDKWYQDEQDKIYDEVIRTLYCVPADKSIGSILIEESFGRREIEVSTILAREQLESKWTYSKMQKLKEEYQFRLRDLQWGHYLEHYV